MTTEDDGQRYSWLRPALADGGVVVSANRRLARELTIAWGEAQLTRGKQAWPTPRIHSWQGWLVRMLSEADDPQQLRRRLDPAGAAVLWERCLAGRLGDGVLNSAGVARQAGLSWSRLVDWDAGIPALLGTAESRDEKLFAGAAADYSDLLDAGNWTDMPGIVFEVVDQIRHGNVRTPGRLTLAGFDRFTPSVTRVREALESAGCSVAQLSVRSPVNRPLVAAFDDTQAELRAAGAWARGMLGNDPGSRIGIICPGLENDADRVVRHIREGLAPGWQLAEGRLDDAVEVSYGRRLALFPAIASALLLMRWVVGGLKGGELSPVILSPFLGTGPKGGRERLELELREYPDREWTADAFLQAFRDRGGDDGYDGFLDIARTVRDSGNALGESLAPPDCVRRIDQLLASCGWPGETPLDSPSFQLVNRWRELLNEFSRIEAVLPGLRTGDAIRRIAGMASETVWQPESVGGAVQVMGSLEAAGLEFDALWIVGVDAGQWPPPSRPLPYVSVKLQRERGMPDATPSDTLGYARRVLHRLVASAPNCVLSWSRAHDDSEQVRSTLLDEFETADYEGPADPGWYAAGLCAGQAVERIDDDEIRPVAAGERVWGGAYTAQRQFSEPFSAVVYGRFGVRRPEPFVAGLSAALRGNIIHSALHGLLAEKPPLSAIREWSVDEQSRRIGAAVDGALGAHIRHADAVLARLIGLERSRVRGILFAFIGRECQRDPRERVLSVEAPFEYQRNGVTLRIRIDRIDELPDGRVLIIDYKTGAPKHFLLQTGELRDIQPVLYADAIDSPVGGIAFLNIDSRAITWKQVRADEDDEFGDKLERWIRQARRAVESLAAGDIRVNLQLPATERRPLAILSRIEELRRGV